MELTPLAQEMVTIADDIAIALAAHRAVVRVAGETGETALLRRPFHDRAEDAEAHMADRVAKLNQKQPDIGGTEGDLRRHLAAVQEYLNDPVSAAEQLHEAGHRYRVLTRASEGADGVRSGLIDKFGLAIASFSEATVLRRSGRLTDAQDALTIAADQVPGSGFDYATGIIAAESALVSRLSGTGDPMFVLEAELRSLRSRGLLREAAYVMGMMACLLASDGRFEEVQRLLQAAAAGFGAGVKSGVVEAGEEAAFYPPGSEVDRVLDLAVAHYRRGLVLEAMSRREESLEAFNEAIQMINEVPAGWYKANYLGDPLGPPFKKMHDAAKRLCFGQHEPRIGRLILCVAENLRRSTLAGFLRREVRKMYTADFDVAVGEEGTFLFELAADRMIDEDNRLESPPTAAEWQQYLSESFVDAFYAPPIDLAAIKRLMGEFGDRHGLVTLVGASDDGDIQGVTVWIRPNGSDPLVHPFVLTAAQVLFIDRIRDDPDWYVAAASTPEGAAAEAWAMLGQSLLPELLRSELLAAPEPPELIVVPDGILGCLPWPALLVAGSRRLVQCADIAIVPSLTLLGKGRIRLRQGASAVSVGLIPPFDTGAQLDAWTDVERSGATSVAWLRGDKYELRDSPWLGGTSRPAAGPSMLYLVTHGEGDGLDQRINLRNGSFTAMEALFSEWPEIVMLASCHVSRTRFEPGMEPLGLPMACLAAGASVFIAGVHEVAIESAAVFHRRLIQELIRCDPVRALANAQRAWLNEGRSGELDNWAALQAYVLG